MFNALKSLQLKFWRPQGSGNFGYKVSLLAGGTVLAQTIVLLAAPFVTRLYSVEDFGNFQTYISVLAFGLAVVAARYEQAVLLVDNEADAACVIVLSLGTVVLCSLGYGMLLWALGNAVTLSASLRAVWPYCWLVPVTMFGTGVYVVVTYWAMRRNEYRQLALTKITQSIGQIGTQILLGGFLKVGLIGLILGDIFGRCSGSTRLFLIAWKKGKADFLAVRWERVLFLASRYRAFPLISSGSALLNTAGFAVPALMIGGMFGSKTLGWFALVERALNAPAVVCGMAVSQVYLGEATEVVHTNPSALRSLYFRRMRQLALIGVLPFLLVWLPAPWLFENIFGANWREAGYYARILIPMSYVGLLISPLSPTLNILERQGWQLGWDIGRLALTVGGLFILHLLNGSGRAAIAVYGAALLISYLVHLWLCVRAFASPRNVSRQND